MVVKECILYSKKCNQSDEKIADLVKSDTDIRNMYDFFPIVKQQKREFERNSLFSVIDLNSLVVNVRNVTSEVQHSVWIGQNFQCPAGLFQRF